MQHHHSSLAQISLFFWRCNRAFRLYIPHRDLMTSNRRSISSSRSFGARETSAIKKSEHPYFSANTFLVQRFGSSSRSLRISSICFSLKWYFLGTTALSGGGSTSILGAVSIFRLSCNGRKISGVSNGEGAEGGGLKVKPDGSTGRAVFADERGLNRVGNGVLNFSASFNFVVFFGLGSARRTADVENCCREKEENIIEDAHGRATRLHSGAAAVLESIFCITILVLCCVLHFKWVP